MPPPADPEPWLRTMTDLPGSITRSPSVSASQSVRLCPVAIGRMMCFRREMYPVGATPELLHAICARAGPVGDVATVRRATPVWIPDAAPVPIAYECVSARWPPMFEPVVTVIDLIETGSD